MSEEVARIRVGNNETVVVEPKGFWTGMYPVTVTVHDEPGNRKMQVVCDDKTIVVAFPEPLINR